MQRLISGANVVFAGGRSKFHNTTRRETDDRIAAEFDALPADVRERRKMRIMSTAEFEDIKTDQARNRARADADRDRRLRREALENISVGVRSGKLSQDEGRGDARPGWAAEMSPGTYR